MLTVAPRQTDAMKALRAVLMSALPSIPPEAIVLGQANMVPEPTQSAFVVMTPTRRARLETNTDSSDDCRIAGSIAATTLTVSTVYFGTVQLTREISCTGILAGTTIDRQLTGTPGGTGTYLVSKSQTLSERVMGCGATEVTGPYELIVQVDCHGDGAGTDAADIAQTIAVLFRDNWAVRRFNEVVTGVEPLWTDDPRQMPFINAEQMVEDRWIVDIHLQVNEVIAFAQEYADSAVVGLIDVDVEYPAGN